MPEDHLLGRAPDLRPQPGSSPAESAFVMNVSRMLYCPRAWRPQRRSVESNPRVDITDLVGHLWPPQKEGDGVQSPAGYSAEDPGAGAGGADRERPANMPLLRHAPVVV